MCFPSSFYPCFLFIHSSRLIPPIYIFPSISEDELSPDQDKFLYLYFWPFFYIFPMKPCFHLSFLPLSMSQSCINKVRLLRSLLLIPQGRKKKFLVIHLPLARIQWLSSYPDVLKSVLNSVSNSSPLIPFCGLAFSSVTPLKFYTVVTSDLLSNQICIL